MIKRQSKIVKEKLSSGPKLTFSFSFHHFFVFFVDFFSCHLIIIKTLELFHSLIIVNNFRSVARICQIDVYWFVYIHYV